ncbi:F-box only protein 42 [Neodiprion fabricii]|uniref:F-box only protein 42 n=1 Tax=Neodiprion fabricii TaxID=2872261 RepID=UPI001ED9446C|nr:F-box only protein 42 [Neodiprion fabricii]
MLCKIDDLPDEILEYILSLIPPYKNLQECTLVSKRWYRATRNVIEHSEAHFHKAVGLGSLFWKTWPEAEWVPTIGKRHSHSACTYENSMYVFGGCTATCTTFNDLWRLDLDTRKWVRPITMGSYPSPKACTTMLYYKKNLILFGGWSHPSPYPLHQQWKLFNELHVYSIELNRWTAINALESPPPRSAHSASIHGNLMVIFGGVCEGDSSNEVWCLNLDTYSWHEQTTSTLKPPPRYGQSQIELDSTHLLILGGCTGPNVAMNDAWLLTMGNSNWVWRKVNMLHSTCAPIRIWCHQACKVGDYVIVLGKNKQMSQPNDMSISMGKNACQRPTSSQGQEPIPLFERRRNLVQVDRDENVNGRRGSFPRSSMPIPHSPSLGSKHQKSLPAHEENTLGMAAFREELPRSRHNANRQRQLESLRRMEQRIQNRKTQSKMVKKPENTLAIYVLDISKILSEECIASWIPLKQNGQAGPDERILYSMVLGRGELIVFGGIRKEHMKNQAQTGSDDSEVYNDLHFINPLRYVV